MIVVGLLSGRELQPGAATSMATEIARRAGGGLAKVEVLGLVPGDGAWDARLFELAQAGVGHATVVRAARPALEPADLDLALRYLPDIRALVLVQPPAGLLATALAGADWSGATLVLVGPLEPDALAAADATPPASRPLVLEPPAADPDGAFAGFVAALAARLDAGETAEVALRTTLSNLAADPA